MKGLGYIYRPIGASTNFRWGVGASTKKKRMAPHREKK